MNKGLFEFGVTNSHLNNKVLFMVPKFIFFSFFIVFDVLNLTYEMFKIL